MKIKDIVQFASKFEDFLLEESIGYTQETAQHISGKLVDFMRMLGADEPEQ